MKTSDLWQNEFPLDENLQYLNHAAVAPWPRRTAEAIKQFANENMFQGATHYPAWNKVELRLRERLRKLIGAKSPDDIALVKNTSEALSIIAHGLQWNPGDEIVGIKGDFPSNCVVWQSLAPQGVTFTEIDTRTPTNPEDALINACTDKTRLLAVSSVDYVTGMQLDLKKLGVFCQQKSILFCVDAIQSLGALPFDLNDIQADFVAADGHKWMLGPEGLAVFYCRPELRDQLRLYQYGWHMLEFPHNFDLENQHPSHTATRFECGSPNMLGIHGLDASLSLLDDIGMENVAEQLHHITEYLTQQLASLPGIQLLSRTETNRQSGIVTFRVENADMPKLQSHLMKDGVICALRGGGIRFSPHFYTSEAMIDRAIDKLKKQLGQVS